MRFKMLDGKEVQGRSYDDVVASMSDEKWVEPRSLDSYRHATARRASELYNIIVDASDNRAFVRSLVAGGVLEKVG